MASLLRFADARPSHPPNGRGTNSLASWQPLRVAYSLRLARSVCRTLEAPHRLARDAIIPFGMTSLLRLADANAGRPNDTLRPGSLASWQSIRIAYSLRLARASGMT